MGRLPGCGVNAWARIRLNHFSMALQFLTRIDRKRRSIMFDTHILLTGMVIFFARICDVSIGTVRTIVTVQGSDGHRFLPGDL